jgi:hypothetical protein
VRSMSDLTGRVAVGEQPGIWAGRASAEGFREVSAKVLLRRCEAGGLGKASSRPVEPASSFGAVSVGPVPG